uniref:Uncharacterized protein n=1 Tax=Pyramimonas obovata TaxID=1411642 RepID=A0A7S0WIV6_9CHLO
MMHTARASLMPSTPNQAVPISYGLKTVRSRRGLEPRYTIIVPRRNRNPRLVVTASDAVIDVETVTGTTSLYAPKKKVKGKTVVITGGSQGCGKETALLFARQGYNVVVAAREPERLQRVARQIVGIAGYKRDAAGMAVVTDITDAKSVQELADAVAAQYDTVDVLINNAGVCCTGPFADTSLDDWNSQMQVNCLGAVAVTKAFLPLIETSRGAIVNVNSFGGVMPLKNMTAYTASKYALAGFTDALRYELSPKGVHVAQVHPGIINSDFMERAQFRGEDAAVAANRLTETLQNGMGGIVQKPEEIAQAVWEAVTKKKEEIVVGPFFAAAVQGYRSFGANPFAVDVPEIPQIGIPKPKLPF